jgi:alpha-D-ribose 1-methylphosphonate 5-triphosphate synthase subunit PhnH
MMTNLDAIWAPKAQQAVYRKLLAAFSYPGEIADFGAGCTWQAVLATLCDDAATLADPGGILDASTRAFLRCGQAAPAEADFVLLRATEPPAELTPRLGDLENPEHGATVVLVGEDLRAGPLRIVLTGAGVETERELRVTGFHPGWLRRREEWNENFPMGVDLILCDARSIVALPRTTAVRLEV